MKITEWTEETIREHMFTEVEVSDNGIDWSRGKLYGFTSRSPIRFLAGGTTWLHMRLITKPKKRIMTIKELWGKTLIDTAGEMFIVSEALGNRIPDSGGSFHEIKWYSDLGWRLAGPDLDYETATSLEVEE
jgi:hypothetical protein